MGKFVLFFAFCFLGYLNADGVDTSAADSWLDIVAGYTSGAGVNNHWLPRPATLSIERNNASKLTLPVLIMPVPVAMPAIKEQPSATQCETAAALPSPRTPPRVVRKHKQPLRVPTHSAADAGRELLELFNAQTPTEFDLPPMLIPTDFINQKEPNSEAQPLQTTRALPRERNEVPPTPEFPPSITLRAKLAVPRAGYTEPYVVRWEAKSGVARVDFHVGGTSVYRMISRTGVVQYVERRLDRTGERDVIRCARTVPRYAQFSDYALPGLPDLEAFSFVGYAEVEGGPVEVWQRVVSGLPGELGGARGEALTFRHELRVLRLPDERTVIPVKYTVSADSSVLGPDFEGYEHTYLEMRIEDHDPSLLQIDVDEVCEEIEETDQRERVDPLLEFTLSGRDPRYNGEFMRYVEEQQRIYAHDVEEALRKTLFIQSARFSNSANRQSATSELELNAFADRLDAEMALLRGVDTSGVQERVVKIRRRVRSRREASPLPDAFDWRDKGAVTHVRFQGTTCRSCWAFAVTGAVEGALFNLTGQLVPLSEQRIIDCAHPYGGHGCNNTWPPAAYDYITARGLSAMHDYLPYQEKKLTCVEDMSPETTYISGYMNVRKYSVDALKQAIYKRGPTVVLLDAKLKAFTLNEKGVLRDKKCRTDRYHLNHAVLAVGWGKRSGQTYFIMKNSWSDLWADGGYFRIHGESNTCGILTEPSLPLLETSDVKRLPEIDETETQAKL